MLGSSRDTGSMEHHVVNGASMTAGMNKIYYIFYIQS